MFRSLASFAMVVALLAATLVSPAETHARRCAEKDPETLLSLFKRSSTIYVATFDRIEDGGLVEESEHYNIHKELSYFSVSTALKGEPQKSFVLEEKEYRYKGDVEIEGDGAAPNTESEAASSAEAVTGDHEEEETYGRPKLKSGDTVLLFLKKSEEGDLLELVDYSDGIRLAKNEDLGTYETRINELTVIFNSAGNRDKAVVDWLISTIDDPVTRWDGAFELLLGFYQLEWEEERAKDRTEENTETAANEEYEMDAWERAELELANDRLRYARLVTDTQKQGLLNLLLGEMAKTAESEDGKKNELGDGNNTLMQLVKRWGDNRLATSLVNQLAAGGGDTYYKYQLMETIANITGDANLTTIAEEYSDRLYMEDDAAIENDEAAVDEGGETETEENSGDVSEDLGEIEGEQKQVTYGERRAETLAKFISAAVILLTTET